MEENYFNPRPPCGGRLNDMSAKLSGSSFQSTSPVWRTTFDGYSHASDIRHFNPRPPCGGRPNRGAYTGEVADFNPRPPCGGRLQKEKNNDRKREISIHVPRVEDDRPTRRPRMRRRHFNPRPPCGGRQADPAKVFLADGNISIHVPRVEDDPIYIFKPSA